MRCLFFEDMSFLCRRSKYSEPLVSCDPKEILLSQLPHQLAVEVVREMRSMIRLFWEELRKPKFTIIVIISIS